MTLYPFVFGSSDNLQCFDEAAPCTLEQTSMCAIAVAQKADAQSHDPDVLPGQKMYVPWLTCMDSHKDDISYCNSLVNISSSAVSDCMKNDAPRLVQQYLKDDDPIPGTPTVNVNGKKVSILSYRVIHNTICKADPSLKGCNQGMPNGIDVDWVPKIERVPHGEVVV